MVICAFSCRGAADHRPDSSANCHPIVTRVQIVFDELAIANLTDAGGVGNGDLVQPVVPVDKHGAFDAQSSSSTRAMGSIRSSS